VRRTFFLVSVCLLMVASLIAADRSLAQPDLDSTTGALGKGQSISTAVATVTGTAISPLVGVCTIGIYDYFRTPKELRGQLPVYEKPMFWIPIGLLLILILLKDTIGGFAPLIKKPLDAVEVLLVNKASLLLIGVPVLLNQVAKVMGLNSVSQLFALLTPHFLPVVYAANADVGTTARAAGSVALTVMLVIIGGITMFVVWMIGEAFDVLALLSPFPFLDILFKAARNALFLLIALSAFLSREAGLAISLAIILVSFLLARWAFRLLVFGTVFSWGILRVMGFGSQATPSEGDSVSAFSAGVRGVPRRTYGWLRHEPDGSLAFRHRPWLVGGTRTVNLGPAAAHEVGRGLFFPSILGPGKAAESFSVIFWMSPAYRGSEEAVREALGLAAARDIRWSKGLKSFWRWVTEESPAPQKLAA
jgi:hypothetical protein